MDGTYQKRGHDATEVRFWKEEPSVRSECASQKEREGKHER